MIIYTGFFDVKLIDTGYVMTNDSDTVTSKETAEQECRETVDRYNASLRPGESKREFIKLNRVEEKFVPDPKIFDDDDDFDIEDIEDWDGIEDWEEGGFDEDENY